MLGEGEGDEGDGDAGDLNNNELNQCPLPPAVHDAYISHCNLLDSSKDSQSRPRFYKTHRTFWLP